VRRRESAAQAFFHAARCFAVAVSIRVRFRHFLRLSQGQMNLGTINHCVYCGTRDGPFSDEHTVPVALGGDRYLENAACETCRKITNDGFENACLSIMLESQRFHLGLMGKKARPKLKIGIGEPQAGFKWKHVSRDKHPLALVLPRLAEPALFTGHEYGETAQLAGLWAWREENVEAILQEHAKESGGQKARFFQPFNFHLFSRMLAKIAHTEAIGQFGEASFRPYLPPLILGKTQAVARYVGGNPAIPGGEAEKHIEWLTNSVSFGVAKPLLTGMPALLTTAIRLFDSFNAPGYVVIVGEALRDFPELEPGTSGGA